MKNTIAFKFDGAVHHVDLNDTIKLESELQTVLDFIQPITTTNYIIVGVFLPLFGGMYLNVVRKRDNKNLAAQFKGNDSVEQYLRKIPLAPHGNSCRTT